MKVQENKQTIERSRVVGLKDICVAEVTTNDATTYAADTPTRLAKAITATIKETFEVEYLYSDDEVEDTTETFVKAEIELEVNRLTPGDYALLFDSLYKSGYLVKSESDRAKEVALGFRAKQNNGKYEFVWYYCGKAEHPEESYETIKDKKTAQKCTKIPYFFIDRNIYDFYYRSKRIYNVCYVQPFYFFILYPVVKYNLYHGSV
jgi:phi13 family phage major tail protein